MTKIKKVKKECKKWWEAIINLLADKPRTLTMIVFALAMGFVLVAIGVMLNLVGSASIVELLK